MANSQLIQSVESRQKEAQGTDARALEAPQPHPNSLDQRVSLGPNPSPATPPPLVTITAVAKQLQKSRSRLKEICAEIGLEPIRPTGSVVWLFDEPRIRRLQNELTRREREGRR